MEIAATKTIARFVASMLAVAGLVVISGCSAIESAAPRPLTPRRRRRRPSCSRRPAGSLQGGDSVAGDAYVPAAQTHKVILFSPYGGGVVEDMSTLPEDWMVQFDANSDAYAKVDTVACVEVKDEQPLKECTGYQDDGHGHQQYGRPTVCRLHCVGP